MWERDNEQGNKIMFCFNCYDKQYWRQLRTETGEDFVMKLMLILFHALSTSKLYEHYKCVITNI